MSIITSEIPSDNETMTITENNKRKFDEIDTVVKKYKPESPTTAPFTTDTDANSPVEHETNSILSDVNENESTDSSDRNGKPVMFTTVSDVCDEGEKDENTTQIVCPKFGQIVDRREFRRAGPYIIGLKLGQSPVESIVQYLAKKENTNEFVQLKVILNDLKKKTYFHLHPKLIGAIQ